MLSYQNVKRKTVCVGGYVWGFETRRREKRKQKKKKKGGGGGGGAARRDPNTMGRAPLPSIVTPPHIIIYIPI